MRVETYKCDVCGKQKGDVNHWWLFFIIVEQLRWMAIKEWIQDEAGAAHAHLCGAECVQKKVNEFLGSKA